MPRRLLWAACLASAACAGGRPQRLSAPAPADANQLYFCVVARVNALGYRVQHADRQSGLIQARSIRPQAKTAKYDPLYNEITVTVSHDQAGDTMYVTATDQRHGEDILRNCAASR